MYTMNIENRNKLNKLLTDWPKNTVAVNEWLHERSISDQLKQRYLKSKWVISIGNGAIIRTGDKLNWEGAVYALQQQLKLPMHVGSRTALELQGYGHYVRFGRGKVELFGQKGVKLPKWFKEYKWQEEIKYKIANFLLPNIAFTNFLVGEFSISISAPERAILEYLYTAKDTIEEAYYLMENLTTLRPNLLQQLLESCTSIKVKRLFLFLAERVNHPWLKWLKTNTINLGKGPREIVKDGYLDSKYNITLPLSFKSSGNNESIF